ncbi:hypothetical protein CCACVL1_04633 [Corchorus capsularis]|uniref:Uncharacterized protein n=1 Tax=Corchorus capsularis TaxID=210143 RepID=A0A1R3JR28_COCAP|nr:hypothetical protein CCACVL1_04633 [Corchorus capsularis]
MATEDFSFPTTADLFPCGIDSPPLWRLSPAASPDVFLDRKSKQEEEEECFLDIVADKDHDQERKSFSYIEKSKKVVVDSELEEDAEEKMDILWEDFNEELARSGSSKEALKLSKTNAASAMFAPRRPAGMLVFMRGFRKLFLLHNSHRSVNHRTWQTPS